MHSYVHLGRVLRHPLPSLNCEIGGKHLSYASLVSTGLTPTLLVRAVSGHVAVNDAEVSTRESRRLIGSNAHPASPQL